MTALAVIVCLVVGLSSALLVIKVSAATRPGGPPDGALLHDVYEAAFLAGGPARVVDAALAALHADGRLVIARPGIATVVRPVAQDPVERAVLDALAAAPHGGLHPLRIEVMRNPAVQEIGDGLAARGLMLTPRRNSGLAAWGLAQGILCFLGLPLAVAWTVFGFVSSDMNETGPPFVFLVAPALVPGFVIGFMMANRTRVRVTATGRGALRSYQAAHTQTYGAAALVAVHGVRALPDPDLRARLTAAARAGRGPGHSSYHSSYDSSGSSSCIDPVWCAGSSSGSGCGGSSCGSSIGGGSSCGSSSGSGCGSSSGSSCGSSSSS